MGFGHIEENVSYIKRALSMGILLVGKMNTNGGTKTQNSAFQMYAGGLASGSCNNIRSDHQITYAGYGHYLGNPVWLHLNSWGTSWGQFGYFMTQMGNNTFCIEMEVYGIVPRYRGFDTTLEPLNQPFNASQLYKENQNTTYQNQFQYTVVRGANGMDEYNSSGQPIAERYSLPSSIYLLLVIVCIWALLMLWFAAKSFCCAPQKTIGAPMYIKAVGYIQVTAVGEDEMLKKLIRV